MTEESYKKTLPLRKLKKEKKQKHKKTKIAG